ncbi:MAG: hypothetical protein ACXADL_09410 [Candidatus Thorarchaeota archaeon]|jgi:hypothetical protein
MPHKVKLEIDSVLGEIARVRLTLLDEGDVVIVHDYNTRINVRGLLKLLKVLGIKRIREGTSFDLTIKEIKDYERFKKGNIGPGARWEGTIEGTETTESAREKVRKLQRELGLRY